ALARRGILVRRLEALEAGAGIDTVVFDKTGTLTVDRMAVRQVRTRAGRTREEVLALAGALARHSLHPASRAIVAAAAGSSGIAQGVRESAGQGVEGVQPAVDGQSPQRVRLGSASFCGIPAPDAEAAQVH